MHSMVVAHSLTSQCYQLPTGVSKVYRSARAMIKLNGGGGTWPLVALRLPRQPRHIQMLPVVSHISESSSVIEVHIY